MIRDFLVERYSKYMWKIYRRKLLPKCNFNKVALQIILKCLRFALSMLHIYRMLFIGTFLGDCFFFHKWVFKEYFSSKFLNFISLSLWSSLSLSCMLPFHSPYYVRVCFIINFPNKRKNLSTKIKFTFRYLVSTCLIYKENSIFTIHETIYESFQASVFSWPVSCF